MNSSIYSVDEDDNLELVINIMKWMKIHHMPVIDSNKMIIGLLSWNDVKQYVGKNDLEERFVKDVMKKDIITTTQDQPLQDAIELMERNNIGCLPVISKNKLIAILTKNDINV